MIDMYSFVIHCTGLILDILPNDTISPSGSEKISVAANISIDTTIPPASCFRIKAIFIYSFLRITFLDIFSLRLKRPGLSDLTSVMYNTLSIRPVFRGRPHLR